MEVKIQYFDYDRKTYKDAKSFSDVCTFDVKLDKHIRKNLIIKVVHEDVTILYLKAQPAFDQCCGLREIGNVEVYTSDVEEAQTALIKALEEHILFCNAGALTYTRYKHPEFENQNDRLIRFIEKWPNASAGEWFCNPNSGNMVKQWTLPINQHKQYRNSFDMDDDE